LTYCSVYDLIRYVSVNETLASAGLAPTALIEGGPGNCVRCASEQGQFSQWRLRLLELAAESAVTMLQKIAADTVAGEADAPDDGGLKYARVSKALRLTLALHAKFEEDSLKSDQEKAAQAAGRRGPARGVGAGRPEERSETHRRVRRRTGDHRRSGRE
jgi:hypothetical protein